jgi:hypothetical protein
MTALEDHIQEIGSDDPLPAASGDLIDAILQNNLLFGRTASEHEKNTMRFIKAKVENTEEANMHRYYGPDK